jgi:hypothetical protein
MTVLAAPLSIVSGIALYSISFSSALHKAAAATYKEVCHSLVNAVGTCYTRTQPKLTALYALLYDLITDV